MKRASGQGAGTPAGLPLGWPQWGRVSTTLPNKVGDLPPSLSVVTSQVGLLMAPATQSRGDRGTGREPSTRPSPEPLWVHEAHSLNPMSQVRSTPGMQPGVAWAPDQLGGLVWSCRHPSQALELPRRV